MVKSFCDGCGREINGNFYRISVIDDSTQKSRCLELLSNIYGCTSANIESSVSVERANLPMFCEKCMDKIANYIKSGLGNSDFRW